MQCISRVTNRETVQYFGNEKNYFYLEFRCCRPCKDGEVVCRDCVEKRITAITQWCRKFDHGRINGPIPEKSHMFDGPWYYRAVEKFGAPSNESLEFARKCQAEARAGVVIIPLNKSSKDIVTPTKQEMPRPKKIKEVTPTALASTASHVPSPSETEPKNPKKRTRKPVVNQNTNKNQNRNKNQNKGQSPSPESIIPTHIESEIEQFDTDGFEIEYIKLSLFELNGSTYFRDTTKNKLYKIIKNKIGEYIGRFNPEDDSIVYDVPDSDNEEIDQC